MPSSRLYRFTLAENVLHQSSVWFLDPSANNVLGQWGLLLGSLLGRSRWLSAEIEQGWVLQAENSWVGLLAWFPALTGLQNGCHRDPSSLAKLPRCLGLPAMLSNEALEAPLPFEGSTASPRACIARCLGTQIRLDCALNSLPRWSH